MDVLGPNLNLELIHSHLLLVCDVLDVFPLKEKHNVQDSPHHANVEAVPRKHS